jgi:hypothetical protein
LAAVDQATRGEGEGERTVPGDVPRDEDGVSLRAPFPWFGGKSKVAHLVWDRFGNVPNYVEPFAGSLAVLLSRPTQAGTETVNDLDAYLCNFWRAIQAEPVEVALWAGWPVNETDLHARHRWLVRYAAQELERLKEDPLFHDAKIAGWWAWGVASWIGSGWCRVRGDGPAPSEQLPHLGSAGMGLHRKLPHLGDAGRGLHRKLPHLGDAGRGVLVWCLDLAERLRRVRVACGDWTRVMGESVTVKHGTTGVFLDPPYSDDEHAIEYSAGGDVAAAVAAWAIANGDNPALRIALCGYAGEHEMTGEWTEVEWKARGGYGSQGDGRGRENAGRERIWFSPHCLGKRIAGPLFADTSA